jgi:hypothetical protein
MRYLIVQQYTGLYYYTLEIVLQCAKVKLKSIATITLCALLHHQQGSRKIMYYNILETSEKNTYL